MSDAIKRAQAWMDAANARGINMDDRLGYLAVIRDLLKIAIAARALAYEGQEYAFDDIGLGRGAPNSYWEDLDDALDLDPTDGEEPA